MGGFLLFSATLGGMGMWVFLSVTGAGLLLSRRPTDDSEIDTASNEKIPSKKG